MQFLYLTSAVLFAAFASAAPNPSAAAAAATPTCSKQFLSALSASPKKASSYCSTFIKTKYHSVYPDYILDNCYVATWEDTVLDPILSTVCSTFLHVASTAKSTSASSTSSKKVTSTSSTKKSSSTSSVKKTTSSSSTKKTTSSSSTKKTTSSSTHKSTSSSVKPASSSSTKKSTSSSSIKPVSTSTGKTTSSVKSSTTSSSKTSSSLKTSTSSIKAASSSLKSSSSTAKQSSTSSIKSSSSSLKSSSSSSVKASSTKPSSSASSQKISSTSKLAVISTTSKLGSTSKLPSGVSLSVSSSSTASSSSIISSTSTSANLTAAPTATLIPVLHYDTDTSDLQNLVPQDSSALYYAEQSYLTDPYLKHLYLHMKVNFTYPTVVVEHSEYLTDMTCTVLDSGFTWMTWNITTKAASDIIIATWETVGNLVLVTNGDGCSQTSNYTRSYWISKQGVNVWWDDDLGYGTLNFFADEILTMEGITDSDMVWGSVTPTVNSTNTTTDYGNSSLCTNTEDPAQPQLYYVNPCTTDFDEALDEAIGLVYTPESARNELIAEAMNVGATLASQYAAAASAAAASASASAAAAAAAAAQQAEDDKSWWDEVIDDVEDFVASAASAIESFIDSWIPSIPTGDISINLAPSPLVDSPWGDAFLIYKYPSEDSENNEKRSTDLAVRTDAESSSGETSAEISVYCVDCGVKGEIDFSGSASFSLVDGITALSVGMSGYFEAGINLGIDAELKYTFPKWSENLITPEGSPILEVKDIIIIGPIVELKAELELEVSAEGKILTGASLSMPAFSANLDLVNTAYTTSSGFNDIVFNKYFQAEGKVGASAKLSLPFSVGVGINIIPLDWDKQVKIVESPGFEAEVSYNADISAGEVPTLGSEEDSDCEGGISWDLKLINEVDFNFFDLYESKIADYESPAIVEGCFAKGATGNSSTASYDNSGANSTADAVVVHGTSMIDSTGKFTVYCADDGNLYLQGISQDKTTFFQTGAGVNPEEFPEYTDVLVADEKDRYFYVFPDVLAAYGVSRIRVLDRDQVPINAVPMSWGYADVDNNAESPNIFFVASTEFLKYSNPFVPIACVVEDGQGNNSTKLFAALGGDALETSIKNLESTALEPGVTGGVVSTCSQFLWLKWNVQ